MLPSLSLPPQISSLAASHDYPSSNCIPSFSTISLKMIESSFLQGDVKENSNQMQGGALQGGDETQMSEDNKDLQQ